jgi:hypothetical protein
MRFFELFCLTWPFLPVFTRLEARSKAEFITGFYVSMFFVFLMLILEK